MNNRSVKLLALTVMWACSLIAVAFCPPYKDAVLPLIFIAISVWFVIYFFQSPKSVNEN